MKLRTSDAPTMLALTVIVEAAAVLLAVALAIAHTWK